MTFKRYRMENNLKQMELVDLMRESGVEITQPTLSLIENDKLEPTVAQAAWLAGVSEANRDLSTEEEVMLEILTNAEEPVTRHYLRLRLGFTDRHNRKLIEGLRQKGYWIVAENGGYALTKDPEEFKRWSTKYTNYARAILKTDAAMRRWL